MSDHFRHCVAFCSMSSDSSFAPHFVPGGKRLIGRLVSSARYSALKSENVPENGSSREKWKMAASSKSISTGWHIIVACVSMIRRNALRSVSDLCISRWHSSWCQPAVGPRGARAVKVIRKCIYSYRASRKKFKWTTLEENFALSGCLTHTLIFW